MPISERVIREGTCDKCQQPIQVNEGYIDAMVYGATFHPECWETTNAPTMAKLLGLDDIHRISTRGERACSLTGASMLILWGR